MLYLYNNSLIFDKRQLLVINILSGRKIKYYSVKNRYKLGIQRCITA